MAYIADDSSKKYDFFLSHAREDKESVVLPLYARMANFNLRVWLDEFEILPGDKVRRKVNEGLSQSRCGILVLSEISLQKRFPREEFDALMNLEELGTRVIPLLHGVDYARLTRVYPLLANNLFLTTESSIENVADQLRRLAEREWSHKSKYEPGEYSEVIEFPLATVAKAQRAIHHILRPATWSQLSAEVDLSMPGTWMGCKNPSLIRIGFEILLPIMIFAKDERVLRRSRSTYNEPSKVALELLSTAYEAYVNAEEFAHRHGTAIDYTPQVKNWRHLRELNPGKYLWQGLDRETLQKSIHAIERALGPDLAGIKLEDYVSTYTQIFDRRSYGYKEIGLLYNPIYRFTPIDRPVFIRLLCLWFAVYGVLLKLPIFDSESDIIDIRGSFVDALDEFVGLTTDWPADKRYEPPEVTKEAVLRYAKAILPHRFVSLR